MFSQHGGVLLDITQKGNEHCTSFAQFFQNMMLKLDIHHETGIYWTVGVGSSNMPQWICV